MKIRTFIITAMSLFVMLICCNCASAQRSTELPVAFCDVNGRTANLEAFNFKDLKLTGAPNYQLQANLEFSFYNGIEYSENEFECTFNLAGFNLICYDAVGNYLTTLPFPSYDGDATYYNGLNIVEVYLPDTTAMVELTSATSSNTYLYCPYENVYAADGRVLGVPKLQVPVYKTVGWYEGVWVYTEDWTRDMIISPFQVAAYEKVGWYTYDTCRFRNTVNSYNEAMAAKKYDAAINAATTSFDNYNYTSYCQTLKTAAMDAWRNATGAPIGIVSTYGSGSKANVTVRNISYKPIVFIRLYFDVYDSYGNYIRTNAKCYYAPNIYLSTFGTNTFGWDIKNAHSIRNVRVLQVKFSDGTSWGNW